MKTKHLRKPSYYNCGHCHTKTTLSTCTCYHGDIG